MTEESYLPQIERMIKNQLKSRGISDEAILEAFRKNPRHLFVPEDQKSIAYADRPLPIGEGQTISQPYIVALMTQMLELESDDVVLEIGTGSGFQTAILASLAKKVFTIERKEKLQQKAKQVHQKLDLTNISYRVGDGTSGWSAYSPYDRILGTGSVPDVPRSLIDQLALNGRLVIPAGGRRQQRLVLLTKKEDGVRKKEKVYCSFLPLIGEEGWD